MMTVHYIIPTCTHPSFINFLQMFYKLFIYKIFNIGYFIIIEQAGLLQSKYTFRILHFTWLFLYVYMLQNLKTLSVGKYVKLQVHKFRFTFRSSKQPNRQTPMTSS